MTELIDLEPCTYFSIDDQNLISVGWLSRKTEFEKGSISEEYYERISELVKNPWEPITHAGVHLCDLCQFSGPAFTKNVFIPYNEQIYVAPEAIVHYSEAHWYKPPNVFIEAVLNCPEMNTMAYKKALLANGGRNLVKLANA
jgi:hypothetical protein